MPFAMLPTKSLQHCQDQMIRANVAKQKSAALPRADDLGQCKHVWADYHPIIPNKQRVEGRSLLDMTKRHLPLYQGKYPKISVFISLLLLPSINQIVNGERRQIT